MRSVLQDNICIKHIMFKLLLPFPDQIRLVAEWIISDLQLYANAFHSWHLSIVLIFSNP